MQTTAVNPRRLILLVLALALLNSGFTSLPVQKRFALSSASGLIKLAVKPIAQRKVTSCGEAALTMVYNYVYPQGPLDELEVVAFAMQHGYYVDNRPPFTSPANLVKIAEYYVSDLEKPRARLIQSGNIATPEQGLQLLFEHLQKDEPVIIDGLTQLGHRYSGAHFVVVTGLSQNPAQMEGLMIYYNDPLTGHNEVAPWSGPDGIWNAWQNNGDPGGAGWWLMLSQPEPLRLNHSPGR